MGRQHATALSGHRIRLPALVDMDRSPGLRVIRAGRSPVLWRGQLEYVNASPARAARFALTVFEPGVGPGSRSEADDA